MQIESHRTGGSLSDRATGNGATGRGVHLQIVAVRANGGDKEAVC
jgi:hypothetical protein